MTPGSAASGSTSVTLDIRGSRTTTTRRLAAPCGGRAARGRESRSRESSASSHRSLRQGSTPSDGPAGHRLQHVQAGGEQPEVTAELVDDEAGDVPLVGGIEHREGPVQGSEQPAPVDVPDDDDRQARGPRQAHVRDVAVPQVNLGRAARALADDHVEPAAQVREARRDRLLERRLEFLVVEGAGLGDRFAQQDDLAAGLAARLEQHRVHRRLRLDAGGRGLHRLGAADLGPAGGYGGVQRHVLRLERGHPHALPGQPPAQSGGKDALAGVRRGSRDEQSAFHRAKSIPRRIAPLRSRRAPRSRFRRAQASPDRPGPGHAVRRWPRARRPGGHRPLLRGQLAPAGGGAGRALAPGHRVGPAVQPAPRPRRFGQGGAGRQRRARRRRDRAAGRRLRRPPGPGGAADRARARRGPPRGARSTCVPAGSGGRTSSAARRRSRSRRRRAARPGPGGPPGAAGRPGREPAPGGWAGCSLTRPSPLSRRRSRGWCPSPAASCGGTWPRRSTPPPPRWPGSGRTWPASAWQAAGRLFASERLRAERDAPRPGIPPVKLLPVLPARTVHRQAPGNPSAICGDCVLAGRVRPK